jgi:hypothetical protein
LRSLQPLAIAFDLLAEGDKILTALLGSLLQVGIEPLHPLGEVRADVFTASIELISSLGSDRFGIFLDALCKILQFRDVGWEGSHIGIPFRGMKRATGFPSRGRANAFGKSAAFHRFTLPELEVG